MRGWTIELVLLTALLPFAIGTIDLFARCRRRRVRLGPAVRSLRSRLLFWGYAGLLLFVAAKLGAFPDGEPRPLPVDRGLYQPSPVVLAVLGLLLLGGWLVARERLIPRRPARIEEALAGHTVALLALGLTALVVVATNPFSLIYLLPSLYAWLWLPQTHAAHPIVRFTLLAIGLHRAADPHALVRRRGSTSASRHRGTCSRSSRSATSPGSPWLLGLVWLAIGAQLTALTAGRYGPTRPRAPAARARRSALCSLAEPTAARGRRRWKARG